MKFRNNKMKRKGVCTFLFLVFVLSYCFVSNPVKQYEINEKSEFAEFSSLTPHSPIIIDSDDDFVTLGFPGSGTIGDPYRIEGYSISTSENYGINIDGVTSYFLISNCYVDAVISAIYLNAISSGLATIENNTCVNSDYGIYVYSSPGSLVVENTCNQNTQYGILLSTSSNSVIRNNTVSMNLNGMMITGSYFTTLYNNTITDSTENSFRISYCSDSLIFNNTFISNNGAFIGTSSGTTIAYNTFHNDGIQIYEGSSSEYLTYIVENNTVNNKLLGYYVNVDYATLTNPIYGQLLIIDSLDVVVSNQILTDTHIGLFVAFCENAILINNTCSNGYLGISYYENTGGLIDDNICFGNHKGISLDSSDGATLQDNLVYDNDDGISLYSVSGANILDSTCPDNNHHGIYLSS